MAKQTVSKITEFGPLINYRWTINHFSAVVGDLVPSGTILLSPQFPSGVPNDTGLWQLKLKQGTYLNRPDILFIAIVFSDDNDSSRFKKKLCARVSIFDSKDDESLQVHLYEQEKYHRLPYVQTTQQLLSDEDLLPGGHLRIYCEILDVKNGTPISIPQCSLIDDLQDLLESSYLSDITLLAGGREFKAHKAILAARSPVFRTEILDKSFENCMHLLSITEETLEKILKFVYTAKNSSVEISSVEECLPTLDLWYAAERYKLYKLKFICENALRMAQPVGVSNCMKWTKFMMHNPSFLENVSKNTRLESRGETVKVHHINLRWTIKNFASHQNAIFVLESPEFMTSLPDGKMIKWFIKLNKDFSFSVSNEADFNCLYYAYFSALGRSSILSLGSFHNIHHYLSSLNHFKKTDPVTKEVILESGLSLNGNLIVQCEIVMLELSHKDTLHEIPECRLSNDLQDLRDCEDFCDVTLCSGEKKRKFKAHKFMLAARSPVFKAMFRHDMQENSKDFVEMVDISDKTIEYLLNFIYTGDPKIEEQNVETHQVIELLHSAEKHQLARLKSICGNVFISIITVDSALDILSAAELMNLEQLKESTMRFISAHWREVLDSVKWSALVEENFDLAKNILVSLKLIS